MTALDAAEMSSTRLSSQIELAPFTPGSAARRLPSVRAYIDETGDRGPMKGAASPIFGMAAVVVDEHGEEAARSILASLRSDFGTPADRPLSWKEDLKNHERRTHAARRLAGVERLKVVYVVADKASLNPGTYRDDVTLFYNVVAYDTLQRALWSAQCWPGGRHQVADVYAGFAKAAFWPNRFGDVEGAYLTKVWHQIRKSEDCVIGLGLRVKPRSDLAKTQPWWPCTECASTH